MPAGSSMDASRGERHEILFQSLDRAIGQLNHPYYTLHRENLRKLIHKSISFPKNNNSNSKGNNGKPHDVETRIALTLYHQWKREANGGNKESSNEATAQSQSIIVTSDLGLSRELTSPRQLANLLVPLLEDDFSSNPQWNMSPDVRSQPSGILSMISLERSQMLRLVGRLPCPYCIQWCKGEKGLWWHQQQYHKVEHSSATAVAQATTINSGAIILYTGNAESTRGDISVGEDAAEKEIRCFVSSSPMECIREGNLDRLQEAVQKSYQPSTAFDAKGATPLMWAAGGGHLDICKYLIEDCGCDPCQPQKGKRSFCGRTALHWAARNGHIDVVRYLLSLTKEDPERTMLPIPIHKLLEAKTQDGTTAFGWACWQRHLDVMVCLYEHGCDIHALNSFGCSPVLWCSQGARGDGLTALQWLCDRGCNMKLVNHNGHGVLHKAAQRGQTNVAEWLVGKECKSLFDTRSTNDESATNTFLAMIGPDVEGYCPSDLAGMEGHQDFAEWLAKIEIRVCERLGCTPFYDIPKEYSSGNSSSSHNIWEQYGGLRRIRSAVLSSEL